MLQDAKPSLQRRGIIERPYVPKKDSDTGDSGDDNQGGGSDDPLEP